MTRQDPDKNELKIASNLGHPNYSAPVHDMLQESLQNGGTATLTVSSNSMSPLFWRGDDIIIASVSIDGLEVGDVITVIEGDGFLTHRYWGQTETGLLQTKGDRFLVFDTPWQTAVLMGRVVARKRKGRMLWLNTGRGQCLSQAITRITAIDQRLFANKPPHKLGVKLGRALLLGGQWGLTAVIR